MANKPRSIIIYAESGDTKTSQCYHFVKWLYEKTGKRCRYICADGGGYEPVEKGGLIEMGLVEVFDITNRPRAIGDINRLSQGFWPRIIQQGVKRVRLFDNSEQCKTTPAEWKELGGYIVEGATGIASALLSHIRNSSETVGFKFSYSYEEDGYRVQGLQEGHYGIVQQELYKLIVQGFENLPIDYLLFTARVGKGERKRTQESCYGPQVCGNAVTPDVPSWFKDCIHLSREFTDIEREGEKVKLEQVVAWFQNHPDINTGIDYLCKTRLTPEVFPVLLRKFPAGYIPMDTERGIGRYLDALEILEARAKGINLKWKQEVDSKRNSGSATSAPTIETESSSTDNAIAN